jgi:hypothetical protein
LAIIATPATDDIRDYAAGVGVSEPDRVPATSMRAADPGRPAVEPRTVGEFLRVVDAAEQARTTRSLHDSARSVEARFVTLRFRSAHDCSAVVLQLDTAGTLRRRFPSPAGVFVFGESPNRFAGGVPHVLPRPVIIANPNRPDRVAMHPGFDVPSDLAAPRIWLLLALRTARVDDALLAEIDAMLESSAKSIDHHGLASDSAAERDRAVDASLRRVEEWLRDRGFELARASAAAP